MKASCSAAFCCFLLGAGDIVSKHRVLHVRVLRCRIEKPFENIGFDPVSISIEYGIPFAKTAAEDHARDFQSGPSIASPQ